MTDATGLKVRDEVLSIEQVEAREKDRRARRKAYDRVSAVIYPIVTLVGAILLWEVGVRVFKVPPFLAPPPSMQLLDTLTKPVDFISIPVSCRRRHIIGAPVARTRPHRHGLRGRVRI